MTEVTTHTWVFHSELDRWSEVSVESVPDWENVGWTHRPEGPPRNQERMFSAAEIAARSEAQGIVVVPPEEADEPAEGLDEDDEDDEG